MPPYRILEIEKLLWNDWNVAHIARHGLTPSDVEAACAGAHIATDTYGDRLLLTGATQMNAMITVILDPEGEGVYFPVTARPASRKEREIFSSIYRKEAA